MNNTKRTYTTPYLNVEKFELSRSISSTCDADPVVQDFKTAGYFGFVDGCQYPMYEYQMSEYQSVEKPCYHTVNAVFTSV